MSVTCDPPYHLRPFPVVTNYWKWFWTVNSGKNLPIQALVIFAVWTVPRSDQDICEAKAPPKQFSSNVYLNDLLGVCTGNPWALSDGWLTFWHGCLCRDCPTICTLQAKPEGVGGGLIEVVTFLVGWLGLKLQSLCKLPLRIASRWRSQSRLLSSAKSDCVASLAANIASQFRFQADVIAIVIQSQKRVANVQEKKGT